jgi:hypothetical protein
MKLQDFKQYKYLEFKNNPCKLSIFSEMLFSCKQKESKSLKGPEAHRERERMQKEKALLQAG